VQKLTELSLRQQGIVEGWCNPPPIYDTRRYSNHYYHSDFEVLSNLFKESNEQREKNNKKAFEVDKIMRNFIPYKVAKRIK